MLSEQIKQARNLIERTVNDGRLNFINGEFVEGNGDTIENYTPTDNSLLHTFQAVDLDQLNTAIASSQSAFKVWRAETPAKRKKILHNIADKIIEHADEIALAESMDTGQPIRYMSKAAIRGAENFRYYGDKILESADGKSMPTDSHLNYTCRTPIGPVGVITPWNTPFMLATWKIAPALAAGCSVVFKPSELSPVTAVILSHILNESGLPDGVVNTVHGFGHNIGKTICEHPRIKAIGFVGGAASGKKIMAQGAETLKRVHLELGGKNPIVVFDDADLDRALDAALFMIYSLNGERCTSSSRLLIQENIYQNFIEKMSERIAKIKIGHPLDPETELGPLISKNHFAKVCSYFKIAKEESARIVSGGKALEKDGGNYVLPTLFADANTSMRISQEEIFGPVLTSMSFRDEADAIEIANSVAYGLSGYIWTNNMSKGLRVAHAIDSGMIWVNSENIRHLTAPFGGVKESGIGKDGGDYSFDFYMETKNICIAMDNHKIPKLGI